MTYELLKNISSSELKECKNFYDAVEYIKKNYEPRVNLDIIEPYKEVQDYTKLVNFIDRGDTINEFINEVLLSDTDYKHCLTPILDNLQAVTDNRFQQFGYFLNNNDVSDFVSRPEIELLHININKKTKNNVIICAGAGVGKTTLVLQYAWFSRKSKSIFYLDLPKIVAGTKYRGELEEKIIYIFSQSIENKFILFIDEIHTLASLGNSEGGINLLDIMKPYLLKNEFQVIGATTPEEIELLLNDRAFKRRFNIMKLESLTQQHLVTIFDTHISDEPCVTFENTKKFLDSEFPEESYPDKLIDFLEFISSLRISVKDFVHHKSKKPIDINNFDELCQVYIQSKYKFMR